MAVDPQLRECATKREARVAARSANDDAEEEEEEGEDPSSRRCGRRGLWVFNRMGVILLASMGSPARSSSPCRASDQLSRRRRREEHDVVTTRGASG